MYQILQPIQVGPMLLKNRIAYLGMAKSLATADHFVTDRQIEYYTNYARNDVALISTGACIVFPEYPSKLPFQPGLYDDKFIPGWKKLADSVHQFGGKIVAQLWHPGKSAYGCTMNDTKWPADFTIDEVHQMQDGFVEAFRRAKEAGLDGCEFHIAHNYLPEQFCVPHFNKRTDEYGADTVENAARFSTEIIRRAKEVCGEDFAIVVKINAFDMGVEGGMTPERCAQICALLEEAGAHMFTISAGGGLTDLTGMSGDGYRAEGWKIDYAEYIKERVNVPVAATGSIRHLTVMEEALRSGKCDIIGIGRGLLAEPEFVTKVKEGRLSELRYCINCMNCFHAEPDNGGHCSVNPAATYEYLESVTEDGDRRAVAVVGAGPAGVEAALALSKRNFDVTLYDKDGYVGGSVRHAAAPVAKDKLYWALESYQGRLKAAGVKVCLNTEVTADMLAKTAPYAVLVAAGTNPVVPASIPGIDKPFVYEGREYLNSFEPCTGEDVVVIGGGLVGLEIAASFKYYGNNTTVVEMLPPTKMPMTIPYMLASRHAREAGCDLRFQHKLVEIRDGSVIAENETGEQIELKADKVLLCMGFRANQSLFEELTARGIKAYWVGSEDGSGNIPVAVRRGHVAGMQLA